MSFCELYCTQMTFLIPGTIGKCSLEKEHPFLTKVDSITNGCFIKDNAPLVKTQQINWFCTRATGILSTSDQLHYLWGITCFGTGTRQFWDCLYKSWSLHILFFYQYILSILGKKNLLWNQVFSMSGNCCISTKVNVSFSGEVFGVVKTTW